MDISSIGKSVSNYSMSEIKSKNSQTDFEKLLKDSMKSQEDEKLKEACKQYESYFLDQMFKGMRKTIPKSELLEQATGHEMYEDMLYEGYAKEISKGQGIGVADMMFKQLSKDAGNKS